MCRPHLGAPSICACMIKFIRPPGARRLRTSAAQIFSPAKHNTMGSAARGPAPDGGVSLEEMRALRMQNLASMAAVVMHGDLPPEVEMHSAPAAEWAGKGKGPADSEGARGGRRAARNGGATARDQAAAARERALARVRRGAGPGHGTRARAEAPQEARRSAASSRGSAGSTRSSANRQRSAPNARGVGAIYRWSPTASPSSYRANPARSPRGTLSAARRAQLPEGRSLEDLSRDPRIMAAFQARIQAPGRAARRHRRPPPPSLVLSGHAASLTSY